MSSSVHVTELLNNLTRSGNIIFYLNNTVHNPDEYTTPETNTANNQGGKWWQVIRKYAVPKFVWGEAGILRRFIVEIKLFVFALKTTLWQKPELIYRRHDLFGSEYFVAKLFHIPVVNEVNGIILDEMKMSGKADRFSLWITNQLETWKFKRADEFIVVTHRLETLLSTIYGVDTSIIHVIENGANIELFKPLDIKRAKQQVELSASLRYICFSGQLTYWQGIDDFICAMSLVSADYPDVRALVVGSGVLEDEMRALALKLNVNDKVIFTGWVPYSKVPLYINSSEICVVPKKKLRGGYSPLKLCEYMACGKPVIASRVQGFELLEEHSAGLLFEPENPRSIAQAIVRLLKNDCERQRMGSNGIDFVINNRSWQSVTEKVAEICRRAINQA